MNLMTGGLQVQALRTFETLSALGGDIRAELFDWTTKEPPADIYHFIGLPSYLAQVVELVREARRPYIITLLFGSDSSAICMWSAAIRQYLNSQVLRRSSRYNAVVNAQRIVTATKADAEAAHVIYGVDKGRIEVIPHGIAPEFYHLSPKPWQDRYGASPFVLCVGAIQRRKGQLLLAQACNALKLPLVLLGPVLPGEKDYGAEVDRAVQANAEFGGRWLQNLNNHDPLLQSAYDASRMVALLSASETQPISVLEAMAARKPVLLQRAAYTRDPLFKDLPQVSYPSLDQVVRTLQGCWHEAKPTRLSKEFSWPSVAARLQGIYRSLQKD
ncbi:MAG: glycosyltransferase family 4 protein [Verrucomicrobia bacterium]|nr:glycosyltransferase family 4 protein [Verrucomicrobiota bacterium]